MSGTPLTWLHANPNTLTIPTDAAGVITALNDIKNLLLAMNHNLGQVIGVAGTLQTSGDNHDAIIAQLEGAVLKLTSDNGTIQTGLTPGSSSSGGKAPKLATPDKFDGSDKNKAVSFRIAVSHYLQV
ncbi:hypothetical protein OPQ81_003872 [Rhizoctonia solani]|nr:hypothetical protein OPQ81_003872 [Rhizoctonia solani]